MVFGVRGTTYNGYLIFEKLKLASDEKVIDGCMCCIDWLRWQHKADVQKITTSILERPKAEV